MAANLLDLAVPGLGSAITLLGQVYAKFCQLKEGRELCTSLHERLTSFTDELQKVSPQTLRSENLLPQLQHLIQEFKDSITKYANEVNFIKRMRKLDKFVEQVKVYNERLDSLIALCNAAKACIFMHSIHPANSSQSCGKPITPTLLTTRLASR